ncbi:MAG TPA: DUF4350 domain-containing protein [Fimbriimonas sp.]
MKWPRTLWSVAWVLMGLLAVAATMASLGQRDVAANPDPLSYGPSGTAAWAEVLRRTGYEVSIDHRSKPGVGPNDLAVAFVNRERYSGEAPESAPESPIFQHLRQFAADGGTVLVLPYAENYIDVSRRLIEAPPATIRNAASQKAFKVSLPDYEDPLLLGLLFPGVGTQVDLWQGPSEPYASGWTVGKGRILALRDGTLATNRFIDRHDNAEFLQGLVAATTGEAGRVVFATATFGSVRDPGLMARIGDWAVVSWYQILLAFLVAAAGLGVRFGYPERAHTVQRSSRELVDAIAETFRRGKKSTVALRAAIDSADQTIRFAYKIPRDASEGERDRILPESLVDALRLAETASREKRLHPSDALGLARRLESEVATALASRNTPTAV